MKYGENKSSGEFKIYVFVFKTRAGIEPDAVNDWAEATRKIEQTVEQ
jgi:hypothetical protein